ncbi:hypothetical protein PNEG_01583 [Pneumocystis murina B123]|uniref:Nudix hydrolase domain-containing protein n=1 Tax=Pneumocystis murina (strain B123) TaxID=1069680 RepID=M7NST3_PNEMU|nr:hypothetical protein PNEG_01583 [Pneumocystis murina B123]EMR10327.1 hypothetical protein PNEG_01583 [Pneumocystis murina B123]
MVSLRNATFEEILDDLSVRFIVNLPEEELGSIPRICFQIEQAHWYYEDFIRELNPQLPSMHLRTFCLTLFAHCPLLWKWNKEYEKAYDNFLKYKIRVPVRGAILLNETCEECVLVKGWKNSSGWGFPKGKINKDELDTDCAIREVFEETGFDISKLIQPNDYIEITLCEQNIRLYIIAGVPSDTNFITHTRKEISKIRWHKLSDLPAYSKSRKEDNYGNKEASKSKYYLVAPFLEPLLRWIRKRKKPYLNSIEIMKEYVDSDFETDQNICRKNSETLKTLLGISSYSPISTTSFTMSVDLTHSSKEEVSFLNKNISDNDHKTNPKYDKDTVFNISKKDSEEKNRGAKRIMELLHLNINNNANKIYEKDISYEKNNNALSFEEKLRKNRNFPPSPSEIPSNFSTNTSVFNQVSLNTSEEKNMGSNYNINNCNKEKLLLALLGKQVSDLEVNSLQKKNLNIKNDIIIKQTNTNKHSGNAYKPDGLKNIQTPLLSKISPTSSSSVTNTNGTAIEKLDAQLLCYLENVIIKARNQK